VSGSVDLDARVLFLGWFGAERGDGHLGVVGGCGVGCVRAQAAASEEAEVAAPFGPCVVLLVLEAGPRRRRRGLGRILPGR
jgi:hypothetical protein